LQKLKLDHTLISFLPILVFLPITYQIINDFHLGGFELFLEFIKSAFTPKINKEIISISITRLNETLLISITSWFISIIFGILFGILSSDIFYKLIRIPIFIKYIFRFILNIIRSIHELVWCLILMQIFGIHISIGILAICLPFIAINAKVISEQLELISAEIIESITTLNGHNFSSLITLIWFPIIKILKNFGMYRLECCLRSTAILGLFGIGGIGTSIFLAFQALNFHEMWTYIFSITSLILFLKLIIKQLKLKRINSNFIIVTILLSIIVLFYCVYFIINLLLNNYSLSNILLIKDIFLNIINLPDDYLKSIFDTIILSVLASGIAISIPPFLLLISQNKYYNIALRFFAFIIRVIPPTIVILILMMFNQPSLSLAAITLGFYNAGITFKLLNDNLSEIDRRNYIAFRSIGISDRSSWLIGLFIKQSKSYLSYCAYRTDIIIRETAIVSIVGSIGLGWQLKESLSSFAWNEVFIIIFSYGLIAIIGELLNDKIKSKFI